MNRARVLRDTELRKPTPWVAPASTSVIGPSDNRGGLMTVQPSSRLVGSANLNTRQVTVQIVAGDASNATLVTYTNEYTELKICKIAGSGVQAGEIFTYRLSGTGLDPRLISVPAVYAGQCALVTGVADIPGGMEVTIQEIIPTGVQVSAISVVPPGRQVGSANLATGTVTVRIGGRITEVSFTNTRPAT